MLPIAVVDGVERVVDVMMAMVVAVVARASQESVRYSALTIQTTLMVLVSVLYASMLMALRCLLLYASMYT